MIAEKKIEEDIAKEKNECESDDCKAEAEAKLEEMKSE